MRPVGDVSLLLDAEDVVLNLRIPRIPGGDVKDIGEPSVWEYGALYVW